MSDEKFRSVRRDYSAHEISTLAAATVLAGIAGRQSDNANKRSIHRKPCE